MAYILRPKISPTKDQQLASKPSVPLSRGAEMTTAGVRERDSLTREPVTKKYVAKVSSVGQDRGSLPKNTY